MRAEQSRTLASKRWRCVALHRKLRVMARTIGKLLLLHRRSVKRLHTPRDARDCEAERDANRGTFALRLHGGGDDPPKGESGVNCRNCDTLARLHPLPQEDASSLQFNEEEHIYTAWGRKQRTCGTPTSQAPRRERAHGRVVPIVPGDDDAALSAE